MPRLPWTIWRYTTLEVGRLVLLTTAVCVLVVAFAATVKPMAEGKLGAGDAFRYMFLAIPPMLQYVLPFAAGFGTTLAFHRMASENELEAARLGGISFQSLLVPAWGAGLVLGAVLGVLGGEVVPRYWRAMESIVSQDVTGLITHAINRGESLTIDNVVIYADRVDELEPEAAEDGAHERMVLTRVAVLILDKQGRVEVEATASRAWVWFKRDESGNTTATVQLENSSLGGASGDRAGFEGGTRTFTIPSSFRDDVKFLTLAELRALPADPDRLNVVDLRRRDLAFHIAREEAMRSLHEELRSQRRARLQDASGRTVTVEGSGLARRQEPDRDLKWIVLPAASGADIEIEEIDPSALTETHQRYAAKEAYFTSSIGTDPLQRSLTLTLHLEQAGPLIPEIGSAAGRTHRSLDFKELLPRSNPLDALLAMKSRELLAEAKRRQARAPDRNIARPLGDLERRLRFVQHDVASRQHEIAAISVSCLIMVLTGSVTAIRLRNRLPVPVYLWSFFPGIASVLVVNAGKEMARSSGVPGLIVIWAGLAALAAYAACVYIAIRRH